MSQFDFSLSKFPDTEEGIKFKEYAKSLLKIEINKVHEGKNKEVEKRYKYYTEYSLNTDFSHHGKHFIYNVS